MSNSAEESDVKPLSTARRVWMVAQLVIVMGGSITLGLLGAKWLFAPEDPALTPAGPALVPLAMNVALLIAIPFLTLAGLIWGVTTLSGAFILNYARPVFYRLVLRSYLSNLAVMVLGGCGLSILLTAAAQPPLLRLGVPAVLVGAPLTFVWFIAFQLLLIMVDIWYPLGVIVFRRRFRALHISPTAIREGIGMSIADPDVKLKRWPRTVEQDFGMIWLTDEMLHFVGDSRRFDIHLHAVQGVERDAQKIDVAALFGARPAVLVFRDGAGKERRLKFYPSNYVTKIGRARRMNEFAERLIGWTRTPALAAQQVRGFEVQPVSEPR
ncbi:MAG: hypothetical protein AAGD32_13375 [Planctomycetota bacterium]